ncbi:MAG TPA: hypothetical protein VGI10_10100 [Polyangiaceae bacterium]|jgi:hypothetical protein
MTDKFLACLLGIVAIVAFAYLFKSCSDSAVACMKADKCWRGSDGSCMQCGDIK